MDQIAQLKQENKTLRKALTASNNELVDARNTLLELNNRASSSIRCPLCGTTTGQHAFAFNNQGGYDKIG